MGRTPTNLDSILDQAELAIAEKGIDGISYRQIALAAGVTAPAIRHHFSAPDELFDAVVLRRVVPLFKTRLEMLDQIYERSDPTGDTLREVIRAFVHPTFQMAQEAYGATWAKVIARTRVEPASRFERSAKLYLEEVEPRFIDALCESLPHLPRRDVARRFRFMLSTEVNTLVDQFSKQDLLGPGEHEPLHFDLERLIDFLEAGMRAPISSESLDSDQLVIRPLSGAADFRSAVSIQKRAWGFRDVDLIPTHWMRANQDWGCQLGAFYGDMMAGILLAYPSPISGVLQGQMSAVLRHYQDRGIGNELLEALGSVYPDLRGVIWTYDPLERKNAYVYHGASKFGGIGYKAVPDYYEFSSTHHDGMPTHRLVCLRTFPRREGEREVVDAIDHPGDFSILRDSGEGKAVADRFIREVADRIEQGLVVMGCERVEGTPTSARLLFGAPIEAERELIAELGRAAVAKAPLLPEGDVP